MGKKPTRKARSTRHKRAKGVRVSEIPGEVRLEKSPFKLKGNIRYLSTDIDALQNYVTEKKTVKITHAARKFGVSVSTVEDWGKILEDHRMIDMHYPVAGEAVLKAHEPKGRPKIKEEKPKKKKPKKRRKVYPRGQILLMVNGIILTILIIYIFVINQELRNNFVPTLNYQMQNLPGNVMNFPKYISDSFGSFMALDMPISPIYFLIGSLITVLWIVAAVMHKRKGPGKKKESKKIHTEKTE